jgi:hypothetical protein
LEAKVNTCSVFQASHSATNFIPSHVREKQKQNGKMGGNLDVDGFTDIADHALHDNVQRLPINGPTIHGQELLHSFQPSCLCRWPIGVYSQNIHGTNEVVVIDSPTSDSDASLFNFWRRLCWLKSFGHLEALIDWLISDWSAGACCFGAAVG